MSSANAPNNVGDIYRKMRDFSKVLGYYKQALEIAEKEGDLPKQATFLGNIGVVYDEIGELQKARSYYDDALKIHTLLGNQSGMVTVLNNIGTQDLERGSFIEAEKIFTKVLEIDENFEDELEEHDKYYQVAQKHRKELLEKSKVGDNVYHYSGFKNVVLVEKPQHKRGKCKVSRRLGGYIYIYMKLSLMIFAPFQRAPLISGSSPINRPA